MRFLILLLISLNLSFLTEISSMNLNNFNRNSNSFINRHRAGLAYVASAFVFSAILHSLTRRNLQNSNSQANANLPLSDNHSNQSNQNGSWIRIPKAILFPGLPELTRNRQDRNQ